MTDDNKAETGDRQEKGWAFFKSVLSIEHDRIRHLIFWPIFVTGFATDLWTKSLVFSYLGRETGAIPIINGFVHLVRAENTGAAFGIAAGQRYLLVAVSFIALAVIIFVLLTGKTHHRLTHLALALLAAGVCGNLYDRLFNEGKVRDFIDVVYWPGKHWPAFNFADTMLCVGVGIMILASLSASEHHQKDAH